MAVYVVHEVGAIWCSIVWRRIKTVSLGTWSIFSLRIPLSGVRNAVTPTPNTFPKVGQPDLSCHVVLATYRKRRNFRWGLIFVSKQHPQKLNPRRGSNSNYGGRLSPTKIYPLENLTHENLYVYGRIHEYLCHIKTWTSLQFGVLSLRDTRSYLPWHETWRILMLGANKLGGNSANIKFYKWKTAYLSYLNTY